MRTLRDLLCLVFGLMLLAFVTATADAQGRIRISIAADAPELHVVETPQAPGLPNKVDVTVVKPGDALKITINGTQTIDTFQYSTQFEVQR